MCVCVSGICVCVFLLLCSALAPPLLVAKETLRLLPRKLHCLGQWLGFRVALF